MRRVAKLWMSAMEGEGVVVGPPGILGMEARRPLCRVCRPESVTPVLCMALVEFTVNSLGQ